jgi:hypothetical protein
MREVRAGLSIVNHFDVRMPAWAVLPLRFVGRAGRGESSKLLKNGRLFDRAGVAKLADAQDLKS